MTRGIRDKGEVGEGGTFPLNIYEIRKLRGTERAEALRIYHRWLKKQRKEDKRLEHNKNNRSYLREGIYLKKKHNLPTGENSKCIDCGKKVSKYAFRCMECNGKIQQGRKRAKVIGKYGGAYGKRQFKKKIKTKRKKAQAMVWFIIALTISLIIYIMALPPEYRQLLLS